MQGILFLKDCDSALEAENLENMSEDAWWILIKKVVTYIKMVVSDENMVDRKGLVSAFKIWAKLRATYENIMHVNQVHLMRKLVGMHLDESKSVDDGGHLRVFGCEAFVHIRPELSSKLDAKSIKGLFMGYGEEGEMGYRIWIPQLNIEKVFFSIRQGYFKTNVPQKMTIKG